MFLVVLGKTHIKNCFLEVGPLKGGGGLTPLTPNNFFSIENYQNLMKHKKNKWNKSAGLYRSTEKGYIRSIWKYYILKFKFDLNFCINVLFILENCKKKRFWTTIRNVYFISVFLRTNFKWGGDNGYNNSMKGTLCQPCRIHSQE